jgi:hypothetical protein
MSKCEPLPQVAAWTDPYQRQPYFPTEITYKQFGYLWAQHLLAANYTLASALRELWSLDVLVSQQHLKKRPTTLAQWDPDKDTIFRVCIDPLTQRVEVTHFGIECVDLVEIGTYANTSDLPLWMQERLAVLCMMPSKPPTEAVEGVGQRINAATYWMSKP